MRTETASITVLVDGEKASLFDRNGKRLCSHAVALDRLQPTSPEVALRLPWKSIADVLARKANLNASYVQRRTPWDKKINNLIGSFRLRSRDLRLPRNRRRFDRFPTRTWASAVARMVEQARNCHSYNSRSGWARWSHTVTKNQNRRVHARYAKD